jgi:hypothetical protein
MVKIINYEGTEVSFEKGEFITKKVVDPLGLEYHMVSVWGGDKLLLLIATDPNFNLSFISELVFVANKLHFAQFATPYLLLPFFEYVKRIFTFLDMNIKIDQRSTIAYFITALISYRERKILEIIRNKDFTEIKIYQPDSKEIIVRAKSNSRGKFTAQNVIDAINRKEYQTIEVSRVSGQIVTVSREETFRV